MSLFDTLAGQCGEVFKGGVPDDLAQLRHERRSSPRAGAPRGRPLERRPLLEPSQLDEDRVLRRHYATEVSLRRVARYVELYDMWAPDLVIRDELDFAAAVLTEELDIPRGVLVLAAGSFIRPEVVAGPLDELRAERGLAPDPAARRCTEALPCPSPAQLP